MSESGSENQTANLNQKVKSGLFVNKSVTKLNNSFVIILSPKDMGYLSLELNSRVMVVGYD